MVNNHCKAAPVPADPDELRLLNLQERLCKLQSELMPSEDPMAVPESPAPAPVDPDELRLLNLQERLCKLQSELMPSEDPMAVPESPAPAPVDPDELRLLNLQERLCKLQSELMPSEDPMAVPESPAPAPVDPDENLSKRSLNHPKKVTSRIARESNFSSTYNGFSLPVTPQVSLQPTGAFS